MPVNGLCSVLDYKFKHTLKLAHITYESHKTHKMFDNIGMHAFTNFPTLKRKQGFTETEVTVRGLKHFSKYNQRKRLSCIEKGSSTNSSDFTVK